MFLVSAQLFLPCHNLLNLLAAVEVLAGLGAVLGLLLLLGDGLHHLQEQLQPLLVADKALRVSPFKDLMEIVKDSKILTLPCQAQQLF